MNIPFDPARTAAIVVGIEKYDAGIRWSLTGPAFDAVRFVEWLRARGVNAANIFLFLSPLDRHEEDGEIDKRLNAPNVQVKRRDRARTEPLRVMMQDDLSAMAASIDTLFVFWGGHGGMENDNDRRLFCENTKASNLYPINLSKMLEMLRSTPWNAIRNQVVVVDACANYFEDMAYRDDQAEVSFTPARGGKTETLSQLVLLSAANGEAAKNDPVRRSGAFSQRFFSEIDKSPRNEWPDFELVGRNIATAFQDTADDEDEQQHPVMFSWETGLGNRKSVGAYPVPQSIQDRANQGLLRVAQLRRLVNVAIAPSSLGELSRRDALVDQLPAVTQAEITRKPEVAEQDLLQILSSTVPNFAKFQQLRRAVEFAVVDVNERQKLLAALDAEQMAIAVRRILGKAAISLQDLLRHYRLSFPDPQMAVAVGTLDEIVEQLCDLSPRTKSSVPPCIEFAERIARARSNADLSSWIEEWCAFSGLTGALVSLRQQLDAADQSAKQGNPTLFIDVSNVSDATDSPSALRYHAYNAQGEHLATDTVLIERRPNEQVDTSRNRAMASVLQAASELVAEDPENSVFTIEVFVTLDQMMWAFDQWKTVVDDDVSGTFGASYPVVLRWIERSRTPSNIVVPDRRNAWKRAAKNISEHVRAGQKPDTKWIAKDDALVSLLEAQIKTKDFKSVVFLDFVPGFDASSDVERKLVKAALCGGAPYVMWWRCNPKAGPLQQEFDNIVNNEPFETFSSRSAKLRQDATDKDGAFGNSLVVLWDDPARTPPDLKFVHPQQSMP